LVSVPVQKQQNNTTPKKKVSRHNTTTTTTTAPPNVFTFAIFGVQHFFFPKIPFPSRMGRVGAGVSQGTQGSIGTVAMNVIGEGDDFGRAGNVLNVALLEIRQWHLCVRVEDGGGNGYWEWM
jgi:hypothetical protein